MNKVVSRRGGGVQQTIVTKDVNHQNKSIKPPAAPRSGQLALPVFHDHSSHDESYSSKRKYKVHLPTGILCILAMVFLLVPLFIFGYRETHIHTDAKGPHFKTEKYFNVNTKDVLSQISKLNDLDRHSIERSSTGESDKESPSKKTSDKPDVVESADAENAEEDMEDGDMEAGDGEDAESVAAAEEEKEIKGDNDVLVETADTSGDKIGDDSPGSQ